MELQRVRHNLATKQKQQTECELYLSFFKKDTLGALNFLKLEEQDWASEFFKKFYK